MKNLTSAWHTKNDLILCSPNSALRVEGQKAIYEIRNSTGASWDIPIVTFKEPNSGKIWIGLESDFYMVTDTEIVGGKLTSGGSIEWRHNMEVLSNNNIDLAIRRFEEADNAKQMTVELRPRTNISALLNPWFFAAAPYSSQSANAKINKISVENGHLRLDLTSPSETYKASVWIDLKSRNPVKAVEDGREVYPKTESSGNRN